MKTKLVFISTFSFLFDRNTKNGFIQLMVNVQTDTVCVIMSHFISAIFTADCKKALRILHK